MRFSVVLALCAVPAVACTIEEPSTTALDQEVIGGAAAPTGKWPDTVAVLWGTTGEDQGCTGTLVAPNVVITAGHCVDPTDLPSHVLVGASKLSQPAEGEIISIMKAIEYPSSWTTIDAGVLVLSKPATRVTPRPIASGWAKFDIKNGVQVQLVGFGTVDRDATVSTDSLMEAATTITDFDCSSSAGCNMGARPEGEFGAGGMGIDTCPGDSGGPVYLTTSYGTYVMGITSRGYDTNRFPCSEGGIYERPDKIVNWIEEVSGTQVSRGPQPVADPASIMTIRGDAGETKIAHNDPKAGVTHKFEITKQPGYGTAAVREDGTVRVCANKDVAGDDIMEVTVSDVSEPTRQIVLKIPVIIADGSPPDDCDPTDFGGEGGGCCDTRRSAGGSIPLALLVLLVLRRRRK